MIKIKISILLLRTFSLQSTIAAMFVAVTITLAADTAVVVIKLKFIVYFE
jgi:hypothetical protein